MKNRSKQAKRIAKSGGTATATATNLVHNDSVLKATEGRETSLETMIRHGLSQMALEGRATRLYGGLTSSNLAV